MRYPAQHRIGFTASLLPALLLAVPLASVAQRPAAAQAKGASQATVDEHKLPAERGDVIDRIVATVNGGLVLESDVEEEERYTRLYPYGDSDGLSPRDAAVKRLVDRSLILQQMAGFPQAPVTDEQIDKEEADLRKDLPACARTDCSSPAGWQKFLASDGFTEPELRERLRQRVQVTHFIEQRFRNGTRVSEKQIDDYYNKTLLPQYAQQKAIAPPLDTVHDRIEEVLLQQAVSSLLDAWLKTLRESGSVRMLQAEGDAR